MHRHSDAERMEREGGESKRRGQRRIKSQRERDTGMVYGSYSSYM